MSTARTSRATNPSTSLSSNHAYQKRSGWAGALFLPPEGGNVCSGFTGTAVECGKAATVALQTHFFCLARKSGQKEALGDGAGCTAVPQKYPVEEHCGQHTINFLQSYATAPPAWRQRSHRKQLPRKGMAKHTAMEFGTHLRIRRWCKFLMERADRVVRPYRIPCGIIRRATAAVQKKRRPRASLF